VRSEYLFSANYPACGIFLQQHKQMKTGLQRVQDQEGQKEASPGRHSRTEVVKGLQREGSLGEVPSAAAKGLSRP
jgi:hypothetical protein